MIKNMYDRAVQDSCCQCLARKSQNKAEELDNRPKHEAAVQGWYQQDKGYDTKGWMGSAEGYSVRHPKA